MDQFGAAAKIADFDKRNGGNSVLYRNWIYYENGANRDMWPLGILLEPPADEYERLRNILRYHEGRQVEAVRQFDNFKEELMMSGCPDGAGLDRLRALGKTVAERNKAVEVAKANLAATDKAKQIEANRQWDAEQRKQIKEFQNQVQAIRV
jgi:hypothetical protein